MAFFRRRAGGETVTGVEARAGFLDRPVLVLTVSTILVATIFGAMLLGIWS